MELDCGAQRGLLHRSVHFEDARCRTRARGTAIVSWLLAQIWEYLRRVARWMEGRAFFFVEYVCADCRTITEYEHEKIDFTQ